MTVKAKIIWVFCIQIKVIKNTYFVYKLMLTTFIFNFVLNLILYYYISKNCNIYSVITSLCYCWSNMYRAFSYQEIRVSLVHSFLRNFLCVSNERKTKNLSDHHVVIINIIGSLMEDYYRITKQRNKHRQIFENTINKIFI